MYGKAQERAGKVPNIAKLQSLRPETTSRGFDLYCQVMDSLTGISRRERVLIATIVSYRPLRHLPDSAAMSLKNLVRPY